MNAAEIAKALGGRRSGRGWRAPCPSHPDEHPSLDLEDRDGTVLLIDRSGRCTQREILDALCARGLWSRQPGHVRTPRPIIDWHFREPVIPTPEQDQQFDTQFCLAHLRGELAEATREIVELFQRAKILLTPADLARELRLAVAVGGVGNAGFGAGTISRAIARFSRDTINVE
jgi:hypothetical protein